MLPIIFSALYAVGLERPKINPVPQRNFRPEIVPDRFILEINENS